MHIGGIEEARGANTGVSCSEGYILAQSDAGSGGCMLSVSATLDFAYGNATRGDQLGVIEDNVNIRIAEARCLFVRIAAPLSKALAVVLHGLDASFGQGMVDAYWQRMFELVMQHRRPHERIVKCVDGNCRIGDNE